MSKKGVYYEIPEKYKYSFACDKVKIRPIVSEEKDKYLSLASTSNLKKFLPKDINLEENIDILAWAGNFCVVNKVNLNDDCISNKEALRMAELLPYKFTDLEHSRDIIIGCILTAGFSEYGTDKPLTKDEVKDLTSPFNITVGGIIWRVIDPSFAESIEKMGDPDSEISASLSWEVAYSNRDLVIIDKDKSNLEDGEIISDPNEIAKFEKKTKAYGGTGYTEDGKRIANLIKDDLLPLGVGFVSNPAGQVGKVVIASDKIKIEIKASSKMCPECEAEMEMNDDMDEDEMVECGKCKEKSMAKNWKSKTGLASLIEDKVLDIIKKETLKGGILERFETCASNNHFINKCSCDNIISQCRCIGEKTVNIINKGCEKCKNSFSQSNNSSVTNNNDNKNTNIKTIMPIKTLKDITDENLKEAKAADISTLIDSEVQKISEQFSSEKKKLETDIQASNQKYSELDEKYAKSQENLNKVQEQLEKLVKANEAREQEEKFSVRMASFEDKYELTKEDREIVGDMIKNLDDASFESTAKKLETLLAGKQKKAKTSDKKDEVKASTNENDNSVVDDAIDKGEKVKTTVAATVTVTETQSDKWNKAFGKENWEINKKSLKH